MLALQVKQQHRSRNVQF